MGLLAFIYNLITSLRNRLYDSGILKIRSIEGVHITCIGNITVGGTGKTPAVQYFTKRYLEAGKRVAIVSRGYRGKRKEDPLIISDGKKILASVKESGDEPFLHAINCKVPIIVGRNRYKACKLAVEKFDVDTIILDDGFQHRKLKRDRDIVLIDATNPFGGGALLPKGTLREDIRGLERAKEFIITKSDLVSSSELKDIKQQLSGYGKNISTATHSVVSLSDINMNLKPLFWVKGQRVLLFSGLANPLNFEKTVISLDPKATERVDFMDHYSFKKEDLVKIKKLAEDMKADLIITTEKDLVKLPMDVDLEDIYVLKIEFKILEDNLSDYSMEEE